MRSNPRDHQIEGIDLTAAVQQVRHAFWLARGTATTKIVNVACLAHHMIDQVGMSAGSRAAMGPQAGAKSATPLWIGLNPEGIADGCAGPA